VANDLEKVTLSESIPFVWALLQFPCPFEVHTDSLPMKELKKKKKKGFHKRQSARNYSSRQETCIIMRQTICKPQAYISQRRMRDRKYLHDNKDNSAQDVRDEMAPICGR